MEVTRGFCYGVISNGENGNIVKGTWTGHWRQRIVLLLWVTVSSQALAGPQQGLLWRIDDGRGHVSYLLGTIHVGDPRVLALPAPIREAFDASRTFCAEVRLDMASLAGLSQAMLLPAGESLRERLDAQTWAALLAVSAELGMPEMVLERMKPWAVATLLSQPRMAEPVLDLQLYRQAAAAGKALCGLETTGEQLGALEALSPAQQVAMLRSAIRQYPRLGQMVEKLIRAWLARDLAALERLSAEAMTGEDPDMVKAFEREVVIRRNRRMVERMAPKLAEGAVFIAVGALHLPGEEGILEQLRERGYGVTVVY